MRVTRLEVRDFRNYTHTELHLPPGLTVVRGSNGQGKTNLIEALGYLATLSSFRGAPTEAMVRSGAAQAVIRADAERDGRQLLLEAEINPGGRSRAQVNRQPLRRSRDLLGALRVTVFAPDDLSVVKDGPGERRRFLDDALVAVHPRHDATRTDVERVLRQRNALLKQAGGRITADVTATLDVWDLKLTEAGTALAAARRELLAQLEPVLTETYRELAGARALVRATYEAPWWEDGLGVALQRARMDDLRRGVTTVGPHRDDVSLWLHDLPARTHASQGEQRSLALALRLGVHRLVAAAAESPPVLLLDDVFSELDPQRSDALLANLPAGQTLLTTAGEPPPGTEPELELRIESGTVVLAG